MIFEDIKAKARWLYGADTHGLVARAWLSDATLSMVLYRAMAWSNRRLWAKPIALLFHKLNSVLCGCVIGLDAKFGRRFIILHSVGVVVNSAVTAGDDVVIESGVVIGAEKGKSPKLGCKIFFGSGAKVLGDIRIDDGSIIGANAVVVKDVPSNVVMGGVPAKILKNIES
ncbi:hypothetical protein DESUT3_23470 [Desulfuromonas versatilis]|uniref:Serine acetyltransferase n=1 Tax=Desulfuromonas versatilis TaxID=2802975 RepID=A0ABN6DYT2_9BACT|nr:hypothetical protein [Desulfuromonas versatilis]BCR05278.1 hypothetical protein DESUT3_23470 [Desulfuromonas versatilis]